jgi:hypothetical protein
VQIEFIKFKFSLFLGLELEIKNVWLEFGRVEEKFSSFDENRDSRTALIIIANGGYCSFKTEKPERV